MQFSISVISLENFYLGVQDVTVHYAHQIYHFWVEKLLPFLISIIFLRHVLIHE